jgi:hypothetical protein
LPAGSPEPRGQPHRRRPRPARGLARLEASSSTARRPAMAGAVAAGPRAGLKVLNVVVEVDDRGRRGFLVNPTKASETGTARRDDCTTLARAPTGAHGQARSAVKRDGGYGRAGERLSASPFKHLLTTFAWTSGLPS